MLGSAKIVVFATVISGLSASCRAQRTTVRPLDENVLRQYAGVYQWNRDAFVYLQLWNELSGTNQLIAFDESGEVRTLYPTDGDRFFAGPGAAISTSVESRIEFQRDASGKISSLTWRRDDSRRRPFRHCAGRKYAHGSISHDGSPQRVERCGPRAARRPVLRKAGVRPPCPRRPCESNRSAGSARRIC